MKNRYWIKGCQAAALAGVVTALAGIPVETAWAVGPGQTGAPAAANSQGPGGSEGPGAGNLGTGGTGNSGTTSYGPGGSAGPGAGDSGSGGSSGQGGSASGGTGSTEGSASSGSTVNPNAWKRWGNHYLMPDGSAITNVLRRGIDVSRWQGDINWSQVAADDVSFVMIGTRSRTGVDPYFHKNIQGAVNAGIQAGVYIYSMATTPEMAEAEADFVLDLIKDYPVSYPVAFDMEDDVQAALSKEELAAIANAFCGKISQAGYYPIIYANEYWLNNRLNMSLMNYPVWVARYSVRPTYASPVMWQCTSTGSVNGISGNVDIDFQFRDFSGVIPANTWRTIAGSTYYYADYAMQKDTWINDGDGWYYMDQDGLASRSWLMVGGERYYLDETTGKMQYGWRLDGENWYYLGSSGAAVKGWIDDQGTKYFSDRDSAIMRTGWLEDDGQTYYLTESGAVASGWINPDGNWRYMGGSGAMARGWVKDEDKWYYLDQNGVMATGWLNDNGNRYYLRSSGAMVTGWRPVDGVWYYFDSQGQMTTGWQLVNGNWYYLGDDGSMKEGLVEVNGVQYYLEPGDGRMAADAEVVIDGVTYRADMSGGLSVAAPEESQEGGEVSP